MKLKSRLDVVPSPTGRGWRDAPGEGLRVTTKRRCVGDALTPAPLPAGEGFSFGRSALFAAALLLVAMPAVAQQTKTQPNPAANEGPSQNLQLDTTQITGSREQPTVMNILPWKRAGASELPGAPPDSLLNEVVQPVNRVEFRRELRYADPAGSTPSKP
ncbi:hypothetical protein [Hydrocarboniphaga sp.]|uniref:hypothetical protein n=1 Tax=Hydrocarboniphaga sp. TaxID=2033016 RepID=UPI003D0ABB4F